jgi:hypothetical protein
VRAWCRAASDLDVERGVTGVQLVLVEQTARDVAHLVDHVGLDAQLAQAVAQAHEMTIEQEDVAVIDACDFVDAIGKQETAIIDGDARVLIGEVIAVQIYDHELAPDAGRWRIASGQKCVNPIARWS